MAFQLRCSYFFQVLKVWYKKVIASTRIIIFNAKSKELEKQIQALEQSMKEMTNKMSQNGSNADRKDTGEPRRPK